MVLLWLYNIMRREYSLFYTGIASLFFFSVAIQAQNFAPIRLSAGGPQYVDLLGQVWIPDYGYSAGTSTNSSTAWISNTMAPGIYQYERYARSFSYNLSVPNGVYVVNLRFAETDFNSTGERVFNVTLNGQLVLSNFDILAQAGCADCALDRAFTVQVTNGTITIALSAIVNNAKIDGIEIIQESAASQPVSTTQGTSSPGSTVSSGSTGNNQPGGSALPTSALVNCGGGNYTDPQGNVWAADYGYTGTTATYSTTASISNTTTPALYQKERYGTNFSYQLPIANGNYTVTLKLAEIYWTRAGQRIFSVAINNQWALTNFDIIAQAGAPDRAIDKTFDVTVTNGTIVIQFVASIDNAKIDAIEIVPLTKTTPVTLSLSPSFTSLSAGGTAQFSTAVSGTNNTGVQWILTPPVGSISGNGLYTAPSTVPASQTVTVMATSTAAPTVTASAAVTLLASSSSSLTPVAPPLTSITPSQAQLTTSQTQQFTITGLSSAQSTSGTQVTVNWSVSPAAGTISPSGLYTAPSSITTQQTVTVTARNASTSAVLGTASLTLTPPPPPPAAPTGVTATAGNAQVTLSWTASTGATSYNVQRSTVNGGSYSTIASGVTATSYVDTSVTNGTIYYYVVDAVSANGTSPNSTQVSAQPTAPPPPAAPTGVTATAGNAQVTLSWTASAGATSYNVMRSTTNGGSYTTIASGLTTTTYTDSSVTNGTTYYYVVDAVSANGTSPNSTQVSAQPVAPPAPSQPTTTLLPVEVFGPTAAATVPVSFNIPSGANLSGQMQLWIQIHGLKYQTEASVQMNSGAWIPLNNSTVTLQGLASAYGGIGGGFSTLSLTINLPAGAVQQGQNTVTFQFNGTDGNTSGFRILNFNVLAADGSQLIPQSAFSQDDPSTWQPPLNDSADIQAGQTLWKTASLTSPSFGSIQAHCGDCHTQDGRDLKYFNYSNLSIRTRAMFHGLTAQQGDQIASYIRTLNAPAPANGRPWNPPYQPGPGLDSQPVTDWAAGAGLAGVLNSDMDMMQYLTPGGSTASWAATNNISTREMPIALQLPDWNSWLPQIHPLDAWGSSFANSVMYTYYPIVRAGLVAGNAQSYVNDMQNFAFWYSGGSFLSNLTTTGTPNWTPTFVTEVYSTWLWMLVKHWEVNQEFGLEGLAQAVHGPTADPRAWLGSIPFMASPDLLHIPVGATGLHNGTVPTWYYFSQIWYQEQLVLNVSDHNNVGWVRPIDWGYVYGMVKDLSANDSQPQASLLLYWLVKGLQTTSLWDGGPQISGGNGWNPGIADYDYLVYPDWIRVWAGYPAGLQGSWTDAFLQSWLAQATTFTPQQWYQGGWATATEVPVANFNGDFGGWTYWDIPQFRFWGVSNSTIMQLANWAQSVWPLGNWSTAATLVCPAGNQQANCPSY